MADSLVLGAILGAVASVAMIPAGFGAEAVLFCSVLGVFVAGLLRLLAIRVPDVRSSRSMVYELTAIDNVMTFAITLLIVVCWLTPAVSQAREKARRTQCANNLHMGHVCMGSIVCLDADGNVEFVSVPVCPICAARHRENENRPFWPRFVDSDGQWLKDVSPETRMDAESCLRYLEAQRVQWQNVDVSETMFLPETVPPDTSIPLPDSVFKGWTFVQFAH